MKLFTFEMLQQFQQNIKDSNERSWLSETYDPADH